MQITELLQEGVQLMFIGMGSVFIFLSILVFTMKAASALIMRFQTEQVPSKAASRANNTVSSNKQEVIAVITAAISRYRSSY